jgi:hypothetical protein
MVYRPPDDSCSSKGSEQSRYGSEDDPGYETEETEMTDALDIDADDRKEEFANLAFLLGDNDHPPEYYTRQWQEGNDGEV